MKRFSQTTNSRTLLDPARHYCRQRGLRRPITPHIIAGSRLPRLKGSSIFQHHCKKIREAFPPCKKRRRSAFVNAFIRLCHAVESSSEILDTYPVNQTKLIPLLMTYAGKSNEWIRPPETWESEPEPDARTQLGCLLEHLFVKYPPPAYFRSAFKNRDYFTTPEYGWYLHLGSGKSLRSIPDLPIALSKREAHYALLAPSDRSPIQALLWGKLKACGASNVLIAEMMQTHWIRSATWNVYGATERLRQTDWLVELAKLFARTPDAHPSQIGPLIDYLTGHGVYCSLSRSSFKNQTVHSLSRRMEEWHTAINQYRTLRRTKVQPVWQGDRGIRPHYVFNTSSLDLEPQICHLKITELTSQLELDNEGRQMRHCVATYASRCAAGACSIWSLQRVAAHGTFSIATLEVQKQQGRRILAQARSYRNGPLARDVARIVDQWMRQNSIDSRR